MAAGYDMVTAGDYLNIVQLVRQAADVLPSIPADFEQRVEQM